VSLKAVADAENLPLAYLERIAALLKKAGLVEATRGAHGGYVLARAADSPAPFTQAIDGILALLSARTGVAPSALTPTRGAERACVPGPGVAD
jgi:hypothetical protein